MRALELDIATRDFDLPASARLAGRPDPAGDGDRAVRAAEDDVAALSTDRLRFDGPRHVDRLARHVARGRRCQLYRASIRRNAATVADQRLRAFILGRYRDLQEAIAGNIERCALARTQPHLAQGYIDGARVRDRPADQRHVAAAVYGDGAGIGNVLRRAIASEGPFAGHEITVRDAKCGGDEGAGVDRAR